MRIGRLEIGLQGPLGFYRPEFLRSNCHCVIIAGGPFYLTWLGHECYAQEFYKKYRYHRVLGYLEHRKDRQKDRQKRENQ